jgi:AraC-like DNA-binding protein
MLISNLDAALRASSVSLLLLVGLALFRDYRSVVAGRIGIAFVLGSAAHAASCRIGIISPVTGWHAPLIALSTGNVVVFWLFTRALLDDAFALRWLHLVLWTGVVAFSLANCLWIGAGGNARISVIAVNLVALGFIVLTVAQTLSSWPADLVEGRRRLRMFIVSAAALYGGVNALTQMMLSGDEAADVANLANSAVLALIVAAICASMLRLDGAELFAVQPAAGSVADVPRQTAPVQDVSAGDRKLVDALMRLMTDERIYRHDNITIGTLATRLKIPEYRLRRLINRELGYRNFNVFLNNHRIEEVKAALADPAQAEVPVITIAMDAGFQSLGPFNRAFKAITGVTPTEYRRLKEVRAS